MERFPDRRTFDLLENLNVDYFVVHTTGYRADKGRETVGRLKDFSKYIVPTDFPLVEARFVRIRLTSGHEYAPWAISEIVLLDD
jgi:hypothetical protein